MLFLCFLCSIWLYILITIFFRQWWMKGKRFDLPFWSSLQRRAFRASQHVRHSVVVASSSGDIFLLELLGLGFGCILSGLSVAYLWDRLKSWLIWKNGIFSFSEYSTNLVIWNFLTFFNCCVCTYSLRAEYLKNELKKRSVKMQLRN